MYSGDEQEIAYGAPQHQAYEQDDSIYDNLLFNQNEHGPPAYQEESKDEQHDGLSFISGPPEMVDKRKK